MFAFSYCSQSYIINDMDDEVFAVSRFFYVYFRGYGGVCVFTPPQNRGGVIFLC